jgi:hypothetical protein
MTGALIERGNVDTDIYIERTPCAHTDSQGESAGTDPSLIALKRLQHANTIISDF